MTLNPKSNEWITTQGIQSMDNVDPRIQSISQNLDLLNTKVVFPINWIMNPNMELQNPKGSKNPDLIK